ncbi:MAG: glycosyltransferase family 2 protein, partial [Lachnospiraceae bacterium]|nr:glycosyltransferase family 2 protein [Lachnospiraceae bacterium]
EKYIDQCMESVVAQTFPDFEILLINDGSSDGSPGKCMEWDRKDARVIVFDRPNGGVASARNFGIDMARGEYLAFVDPDDWLDVTYLEKLRRAAKKADADYAECDLWRYDNRTGTQIHRSCGSRMGLAYTLREHMKYGPTATYKAISRRRLWTGNGVRMPDCSFESPAVYSLMLALSNRIVNVNEPLYFYRRFRENSLIENGFAGQDGVPDPVLGLEAMDFLTGEFRRTGLYETYADTLEGIVKYRLSDILAMQFHRKPQDEFRALVRNYRAFLGKTFPEGHNEPYITWGGYNLDRILTHMDWLHDPYGRFNFSSIISLAGAPASRFTVTHKNRYRRMMMEREFRQTFPEILRELRPGYLFMDFIEERFDVLALGDAYLTVSDALEEAVFRDAETGEETDAAGLLAQGRVITRGTEACTLLWQAAFRRFTETVRQAVPGIRFVIVENYLSPYVGDLERLETHPNLGQIQLWNGILMGCYNYARTYLTDAVVVSPSRDTLYYTDSRYEYGAVPQHLNEIENQYIAERIERALCPTD